MPLPRRSLLNFFAFLSTKGVAVLLFVVGVHYFVLNAGAADYGAVNLVLVLYTYLWIADVGVGYSLNLRIGRALARAGNIPSPGEAQSVVSQSVALALPFYGLIGAGLAAAGVLFDESLARILFGDVAYARLVMWTALSSPAVMLSSLTAAVLRAHDRVYLVNATQLLLDAWRAGAMILLSNGPQPAIVVGYAFFIGALGRAAFDTALLARVAGLHSFRPSWSPTRLLEDLRSGAPTMGSLAISSLFYSVDRIAAGKFFALQGVAIYSLAADLHTKAYFLLWAFNSTLYQPLVASHAQGRPVRGLVAVNVGGAALIALLYYVPLAACAEWLIGAWIDEPTAAAAAPVVTAMLPGSLAYLLASSLENTLLKPRGIVLPSMLVHLAMLLTLLMGLLYLPPVLGIRGIGWAHSIANAIFLGGTVLLVFRHRNMR